MSACLNPIDETYSKYALMKTDRGVLLDPGGGLEAKPVVIWVRLIFF